VPAKFQDAPAKRQDVKARAPPTAFPSAAELEATAASLKAPQFRTAAAKYSQVASDASVAKAQAMLLEKKYSVEVVDSPAAALELLKPLVKAGSCVALGASTTLVQIGFIEYLKTRNDFRNFKAEGRRSDR